MAGWPRDAMKGYNPKGLRLDELPEDLVWSHLDETDKTKFECVRYFNKHCYWDNFEKAYMIDDYYKYQLQDWWNTVAKWKSRTRPWTRGRRT